MHIIHRNDKLIIFNNINIYKKLKLINIKEIQNKVENQINLSPKEEKIVIIGTRWF